MARARWPHALVLAAVAGLQVPLVDAAYVRTTSSAGNSFTAGTVAITAAAPGSKVFAVTDAIPGSNPVTCVITQYTGSIPATVRMYFPAVGGGLPAKLIARVHYGTGTQTDCGDFSSAGVLYNASGTLKLDAYLAAHTDWATGDGAWAATQSDTRAWRFELLLPSDDTAAGLSGTFTAVWEARS
ncbi:hypothetical protein [Actinoplanes xinjiangensis]|uniref:Camelysin-like metallo-endopeptidase n=1 Tax=Actinoplanes xinjiangensis TaxID=512350 RepID=A0A316FW77_9ACTN|nr:hypothetical protein [Actinoplanes xinjiangensis]PWK52355.1 hypothetical protein BC793_101364 [Actinoplanes xinjiangensis]GIF36944.1 hypothetical protein Axi01nite_12550 [Actinoplanes xinjiangensis]